MSARRKTTKMGYCSLTREVCTLFPELLPDLLTEESLISCGNFTEGRQRIKSTSDLIRATEDSEMSIMK